MASNAWNSSRIFVPTLKNHRLRVVDSLSPTSMSMSSSRSFVKNIRSGCNIKFACSSISKTRLSSSRSFKRANGNFLPFHGSIPARTFSSTTKRIGGNNFLGMRKLRFNPASDLAPFLQQLSFMSSLSPTAKSKSRIFTHPTSNYKTNRQIKITSSTTITNINDGTTSQEFDICSMMRVTQSLPLLPPKRLFEYRKRNPFRIMFPDFGLIPARSISRALMGTKRYFSLSTTFSFNRLTVIPQMNRYRTTLPRARAKTLTRNTSSSGKSSKNEKEFLAENNKSKDAMPSTPSISNPNIQAELNNNKMQEFVDSTVSKVRTNVGSAEATIKRAVEELSTGDLLSVYGIVFLIVIIAVSPSVIRRIQLYDGDDTHYNDIDPEDPVMDLARMIRGEYLESIKRSKVNEENEDVQNIKDDEELSTERTSGMGLDRIIADLLKSPQIEEAATNLVTNIIQSSQFKTACQVLLKELLKDLLDDPDTLKQVIYLLQNAIADEKIKEAAVQLATDIFGDDRVLDELVTLVQRLGMEQQVQYATQALLVESAHNALNDPEILDHSMEFATDVVGDDIVQQTAGEALYNTMSYAFRPTLSVLLTLLGLGLIFISVAAFRNVNQTPSESADRAFLNAIENTSSRLLKLVFLPLDFIIACKDFLASLIFFPFRMISSSLSRVEKLGETLLGLTRDWFLWLLYLPAQFLSSLLSSSKHTFKTTCANAMDRFNRLGYAVEMSFVSVPFQKWMLQISGLMNRTKIQWIILNHHVSDNLFCVEEFGKHIIQEMYAKSNVIFEKVSKVQDNVAKYSISMQQCGNEYVFTLIKGYTLLNQNLAVFAISVEEWLRSIPRIF